MTTKPALPIVTALCPECQQNKAVFRDKQGKTYLMRHEGKRGKWCGMSGKQVKR